MDNDLPGWEIQRVCGEGFGLERGGNAVVAMPFDTSEMADTWTEICAFGTAVQAVPVSDAARRTVAELGHWSA